MNKKFTHGILFLQRTSQFQETAVRSSAGGEDDGELCVWTKDVQSSKGSCHQLLVTLARTNPHQAVVRDTTLSDFNTSDNQKDIKDV